jgi:hypothetical protein
MDAVISHQNVRLCCGAHRSPADGACVMELVSMLAGERFGDRPRTASPVIGALLRPYNDIVGNRHRQDLLACASAVVGSRRPEAEAARVELCVDAAIACYRASSRRHRLISGDRRLAIVLSLAEGWLEGADLQRFGYQVAHLVRSAPGRRARIIGLVEELASVGTGPTVVVEPAGLRVVVHD